jgi:O-antigen/teichoic acid export membrane protein
VAGHLTRSFVLRAYVICIATAVAFATVYVVAGFANAFLAPALGWKLLFIASVVLWTLFMLQDSALIGLRSSKWVPVENILYAAAKLAVLPLFVAFSRTQGVFLAWTIPVLFTIVVIAWYLFRLRIPQHQRDHALTETLPSTRELFLLAGAQYATLLSSVFTPSIVALIVIQRLGPVANAHYYIPSLISTGLALFNWSIVKSFIVEATHEPHQLRRHANTVVRASVTVIGSCVVVGVAFAPQFLRIFGASYAASGTTLLRMLLLSAPLSAITIFYTGFAWIDKRVWWLSIRELIGTGVYFLVLFTFLSRDGILAIGYASLASAGLQGLFFLPFSVHRYRQTRDFAPDVP